ncbi:hypothetical protein QQF64_004534 [Cirrhinus molitorella]|uniref:Envelope protein n=1 Tax=Cirrhinus molitorella TaxID=172907 RepID=A0ABR3MJJ2_9TELE
MSVMIAGVKASDEGKYYCGIDRPGTDWYEEYTIVVGKPTPRPVKSLVEPAYEPATKEETAWMGDEEAVQGKINPSVQKAMMQCQGNKACTLALLQKEELKINTSSGAEIEKGRIPQRKPELECKEARWDGKSEMRPRLKLKAAWSDCRIRINIGNGTADNCTANINGKPTVFTCPFSKPRDSTPAAVWVCGDRAYHDLPGKGWSGCCNPALMNVGTSVYLPTDEHEVVSRKKRNVGIMPGVLPERYNGYKLSDPWTTPGATMGWSIFLGVGTAVSINKINGLAWSVLAIANSTENALTLVNGEMKELRDAVIQNRLVLDMLTAKSGGVCKMLGTSCCFHIPDYSDNITNIVAHMRMAVKEPERTHNMWGEWWANLWGGWGYWICSTVLPILAAGILLLTCLPCIFQFVSSSVQRLVTSSVPKQRVKLDVYNGDLVMEFDVERTTDDDDSSSGTYSEMH